MRFAIWLLERLKVPERNESLTGDLAEERPLGVKSLPEQGLDEPCFPMLAAESSLAKDWLTPEEESAWSSV
jgi:hypothetical protein